MRVRLLVLFVFLGFLSFANAQTQTDSLKIFKKHSLQFRTYNLLSLSSFKGSLVSYKFHTTDDHAYRIGVSARARKTDEQKIRDSFRSTDTSMLDQDINGNEIFFELILEYLTYFNPKDDLKMFLGFGPRLYLNINNFDTDDVTFSGNSYVKENKFDRYKFGLTFSYGLEWFFRKNMSLHAEYGFNISYIYEENNFTRINDYDSNPNGLDKSSEKRTGFEFDDANTLLGISLYF